MFYIYDPENTGEIDNKELASELFSNKSLSKKQKKLENKDSENHNYKEIIQGNSTKKNI